ncbi:copper amine oxidase N-terminal domain-containing protein [Paenibacillus antri]|uniref:Copper amine oxidase N-terminal domain-containing protein n=1 Tax=Paenibacillus antri TaxID=2582848 RepID=A0A5R9GMX9_9BACL|nr:copper amine oxidase N-terminal domain-containing protein [Paenibacillus antri]TLS53365.1 copper amine oxidase N-terminal domain-containing protein [Paenibacillus antri]
MIRIGKRGLLSIAAAGSMLGLIGCEAVGGVDVNRAVADMLDVKSSEGTLSLAWEIEAESKGNAEADRLADVFGSGAIVVTELLQEGQGTASMEGTIELSKGDIPFRMFVDEASMVLDVEGAKQPFELELNGFAGAGASGMLGGDMLPGALSGEAGQTAVSEIVTYILGHVPNPERTKLGSTTATIDGQSKSLATVTAEVGFEELTELVSTAVSAMLEDEAGLKAFIGTLYDALKPSLTEMAKESADPILKIALNNKALAVEFLYGQVAAALEGFAAELEADGALGSDLTPESGATLALLLDGAKPAGLDVGLYLEPATDAADGVGAIRIDVESRWWNANGAVKAKTIEGTAAPFPTEVKPRERLANVESGSLLYDILKNDLRITRHSFDMIMGANASVPDGVSPYIKGAGTTMVPVRYVSEQLDAKVAWDGATSTITIKDDVDGVTIVMKVGSKSATVNGVAQSLPEAPEIVASTNSTFVPIGFITVALGGEKGWDPASGTVTITKEF